MHVLSLSEAHHVGWTVTYFGYLHLLCSSFKKCGCLRNHKSAE